MPTCLESVSRTSECVVNQTYEVHAIRPEPAARRDPDADYNSSHKMAMGHISKGRILKAVETGGGVPALPMIQPRDDVEYNIK